MREAGSIREPAIELEGVGREFGHGHTRFWAVRDVTLRAGSGEVILLLGPSGSGKTTLLSMMGCILRPSAGVIRVAGRVVSGLAERALEAVRRESIGFVFQSFNLLRSLTAQENVEAALNLRGIWGRWAREAARQALADVGLEHRLDFLPADLSGGEKQRVSLARAVVTRPRLILADEPTGSLDSASGRRVAELLRGLATDRGTTVFIVTHDNRIEDIANRILHIEDGLIQGRGERVLSNGDGILQSQG